MRRILSIDGGGIKGVFPLSFLSSLEHSLGHPISSYFDLIVGSSTGGIIALGLGLGYSASDLLTFYDVLGKTVFGGNGLIRCLRRIGYAKYSQRPLRAALERQFGDRKLGESSKRLVVPSLNLETGEVYIYKTSHHERFERDYKERVSDIALATAAAPTYFPTYCNPAGTPLIDGGMHANNPVGLAVVEAIGVLCWPAESLKVLSLGCTTEPLNVGLGRRIPMGLGYWAFKLLDILMLSQSSQSLGTAQLLAGHNNVFRVCPVVAKGKFGMDTVGETSSLKGLGDSEARKALPVLRPIFFTSFSEVFLPCHRL